MAEMYVFNNGLMTFNTMSGSDQRVLNWSPLFAKNGYELHVFTSFMGAKRFQEFAPNVYISGSRFLKSNIGILFVYVARAIKSCLLQRKIKFSDKAVIYSSSDLLCDALPALYMKLRHKNFKLLMGMHLIAPNPFKGFKKIYSKGFAVPSLANVYYFLTQRFLILFLKKTASLVMVSNNSDRQFLIEKGIDQKKVMVTYGACDTKLVDSAKPVLENSDAVFVGRFHVQKGFPDLLKIWQKVAARFPKAKLVIMGEDITSDDIKEMIKDRNLQDNVEFLGYVGGEKKYSYIKSSKILLMPSYYESFGMVALEGMTCGLPVVAYDLPVFREIYTSGMLRALVGDWEEMAKNCIALLSDETLRYKIAKEALNLSAKFSWESTAGDILKRLTL
jgi:glycosyltransferase involved in cell wall biosynthesis